MYTYFLDRYQLDPNTCVFIDDQLENLLPANELGIEGMLFLSHDIETLRARLQALSIL